MNHFNHIFLNHVPRTIRDIGIESKETGNKAKDFKNDNAVVFPDEERFVFFKVMEDAIKIRFEGG